MAENEIKLTAEALRSLLSELRLLETSVRQGQVSMDTYGRVLTDIETKYKTLNLTIDQHAKFQSALQLSQNRTSVGFKGMATSLDDINKKMGNARPLVMSMSQAMQDSAQFSMGAAQGIRAVANNVEMMVQQFGYLKSSGMSTKDVLSSMLGVIKGPLGMLVAFSAFSAALQWITQGLTKTKDATKALKDETVDIIEKLHRLRRVTDDQVVAYYRLLIAQLEFQNKQVETKTGWTAAGPGMPIPVPFRYDASVLNPEQKEQNISKILDYEIKIDGVKSASAKKQEQADNKREQTLKRISKTIEDNDPIRGSLPSQRIEGFFKNLPMFRDIMENAEFMNAYSAMPSALRAMQNRRELAGMTSQFGLKGVNLKSAGIVKAGVGFGDALAVELDKSSDKAVLFGNTLKNAFREATNELADEFIKVFGLGDNLIGRMGATFLSAMVQLGAELLAQQVIGTVASTAIATTAAGVLTEAWMPSATLASIATLGGAAATGSAAVALALAGGKAMTAGTGVASGAGAITPHASGNYWFNEPTFAVGMKTGQRHIIAENRPEYLMSPSASNRMGQQGRYGAMAGQQPLFLRTEISGSKLALIVESGTRQNSRRRM